MNNKNDTRKAINGEVFNSYFLPTFFFRDENLTGNGWTDDHKRNPTLDQ